MSIVYKIQRLRKINRKKIASMSIPRYEIIGTKYKIVNMEENSCLKIDY